MKIIDEKGRLFGKINIIDFIVILVLIGCFSLLYLGYKVISMRDIRQAEWVNVRAKFIGVIPELVAEIKNGNVELGPSGSVLGRVEGLVDVRASEVLLVSLDEGMQASRGIDGVGTGKKDKLDVLKHPTKKTIVLDLSLLCNKKSDIFHYRSVPIRIGGKITFSTTRYIIEGIVIGLQEKEQ
ncbi:MAG: DUF4330 family protein [Candidatus Omnitrophota bacterium]